ncbi:unnamed protein product [Cyprideis torosa]|uniref:Uncharacterized protein n=1 Tax=Cyprideis torosa TaxID=163714 RepID=A0A7R8ZR08_9CRUS|nr:unnamed protein product [Cyprideis torosa]CAG0897707.1 unnamed protein product [Cyprideis torosa]
MKVSTGFLSFQYFTVLLLALILCTVNSERTCGFPEVGDSRCQSITLPLCQNLPYNRTVYPNFLNHSNQDEAGKELSAFGPLINTTCSIGLPFFLCSLFAPVCTSRNNPVAPCRGVCERVRSECANFVGEFEYPWPDYLDCSQFPRQGEDDCVSLASGGFEVRLLMVETGLWGNWNDYEMARFPNLLGHRSQGEAGKAINTYYPLVRARCSVDLQYFLCTVFAPNCVSEDPDILIPPCREFCERAQAGCDELFDAWPRNLQCRQFPPENSGQECVKGNGARVNSSDSLPDSSLLNEEEAEENNKISRRPRGNLFVGEALESPSDSSVNECEHVEIPFCRNAPYQFTIYPNLVGHQNQKDAAVALEPFFPIARARCSSDFQLFLCTVHAPVCASGTLIPPCRDLCESAREGCEGFMNEFGITWPENLNCSHFPARLQEDCVTTVLSDRGPENVVDHDSPDSPGFTGTTAEAA